MRQGKSFGVDAKDWWAIVSLISPDVTHRDSRRPRVELDLESLSQKALGAQQSDLR